MSKHDKFWLWLAPLLLFGCPAPSLAAQTWTTVWTPGSAPATKAGTGSTNRNYNTNCYPCKMWDTYANNGKGGWENLPPDTEPIKCPGDTNDYVCQVCDGNGVITNAPNDTTCDAGHGCGCCVDGNCWAPSNNCKNPIDVNFDFLKVASCACDPGELGCEGLANMDPWITTSTCFKDCFWKPGSANITVGYYEGLCLDKCQSLINSADDVNVGNYCAVLTKLKTRIAKETIWSTNPPTLKTNSTPLPQEEFCFVNCIQQHENFHIKQMQDTWSNTTANIQNDLNNITIPFDCDKSKAPEGAGDQLRIRVGLARDKARDSVNLIWYDPATIREQEKEAHTDSLKCLNELLAEINQKITDNHWETCP